ncbi:MAG TPA: AAA family ATPase, partial [Anaerolineales bacterium]|nr:AAA family ATPase [Anaerolineales bacterium]
MPSPLLVIVTGAPCTGKTTLGLRLAADFRLPFIYKDGIKEILFDRLGWKDKQWSKLLSLASYDLLYYFVESLLKSGKSLIVEANFKAQVDTNKFLALKSQSEFVPFQILCRAEPEILLERFRSRAGAPERHPGHIDHLTEGDIRHSLWRGEYQALAIGGQLVELDTTD